MRINLLLLLLLFSCSKEKNKNWEITSQIFANGSIQVDNSFEEYSDSRPYKGIYNTGNILYQENHELVDFWSNRYEKSIIFEIKDSSGIEEFYYENEALFSELKAVAYCYGYRKKIDGFYKVTNGYISGVKINNLWRVKFCIFFAGKNRDKFRLCNT